MQKVLVANRGEIAVRVIRAAHDAGIGAVAVYADQDRDALFTQVADEAFALDGTTPQATYLDVGKIIAAALRAGCDAVHPGYGFLAENAAFARAVLAAGLTWVGPPPEAIDALGDKVRARHIAAAVGAPLAPGTQDPVSHPDEVVAFAREHGLPVAIKAAFGGGGRGLKVARTLEEIPERFGAATREAVAAFGRGECFVERFLDRPRHVETQCLADSHGGVVVVSTRDCSLQRRHQKLVEEAPAPFLTRDQRDSLVRASKAILREAGYVGAGTAEFLVGADGTISFLEVNTRLQVEHPVSEEVTGIDLVREQFRLASGEPLGYDDPVSRGHSIEFRLNAEDPGRGFLPAPGRISTWRPPAGPGIRVDEGYHSGMTVPPEFDSLIAKVVVTGADRDQAIQRARRALAELRVEGLPTVLPFHAAVVDHTDFTAPDGVLKVHTTWIEEDFDVPLTPQDPPGTVPDAPEGQRVVVEVDGRRLEVRLPPPPGAAKGPRLRRGPLTGSGYSSSSSSPDLRAPMPCTVAKLIVAEGDLVAAGQSVLMVEAMKMEQSIVAPRDGMVHGLRVTEGQTLTTGDVICQIVPVPEEESGSEGEFTDQGEFTD